MMLASHYKLWEYCEYLKDTDISEIKINNTQVYFKLKGEDIWLTCLQGDERSMPMDILNFFDYEKDNLGKIDEVLVELNSNGCFLDIGANIGYTSLHWNRKFSKRKIYAFEVLKPIYEILIDNLNYNKADNVIPLNFGVSNKNEKQRFSYFPWCTANSSMNNLQSRDDAVSIEGEVIRIDDYGILFDKIIDFVKIDVEGAEKLVIEGMYDTIRKHTPVIACEMLRKYTDFFGYHPNDSLHILTELGYLCFTLGDEEGVHEISDMSDTIARNFILLHRDKHKGILDKCFR